MMQHEEKMNNKTSSGHKVEREALSTTHYGTTGEDKPHSKPSKRKDFKRKNKWRKRTKQTSEGKNFVTHLLQRKVINLESQHWAIHYSAATKKAQVVPSTPRNLKFILYAIISFPSHFFLQTLFPSLCSYSTYLNGILNICKYNSFLNRVSQIYFYMCSELFHRILFLLWNKSVGI